MAKKAASSFNVVLLGEICHMAQHLPSNFLEDF
jgi:hypothetical protein